ncbi:MAG: glycosyltransferase family 25 protein, partial [Verrucomicrobiota bacterium]
RHMMNIVYYCISLKRSKKRRAHAESLFQDYELPVRMFEGVDGNELTFVEKDGVKTGIYEDRRFLHRPDVTYAHHGKYLEASGCFGCSLSHYLIYESFLEDKEFDACLIFEDDIFFDCTPDVFWKHLEHLPPPARFDVCLFSSIHWSGEAYPDGGRINAHFHRIPPGWRDYSGTSGYLLTRGGVKALCGNGSLEINFAADDYLAYRIRKNGLVAISPLRPLIVGHGRFESDAWATKPVPFFNANGKEGGMR